jgi:hypothetical protein
MALPTHHRYLENASFHHRTSTSRKHNERQEYQTTEQGVEKKHRDNGIVFEGLFLEHIIESQQRCREKSEG